MKPDSSTAELITRGYAALDEWESKWPPFDIDESLRVPAEQLDEAIDELCDRLQDNYPFFHSSYAGQMLKPPHAVAAAAYAIAQRINPNNHALDGGRATSAMEREVIDQFASMFGYSPESSLGHLTTSGTIANLEALWISRELHPGSSIAFSAQAHYTHERMCSLLGVDSVEIETDAIGRIDLDHLEQKLESGKVGAVVATAGTTALGAVDSIQEIVPLARRYGARVHVDAAYGGFFRLLAESRTVPARIHPAERGAAIGTLSEEDANAFVAIGDADSIVIDPHKHGLQPYGCGAILFRDASVDSMYKHDSPYTYFTSDELHLGEISLECSRAGAAAAALWTTLRVLPLEFDAGFGPILRRTRAAAQSWATLIEEDDHVRLVTNPSLDIVAFHLAPADDKRVSALSAKTRSIFHTLMNDPEAPIYLATLELPPTLIAEQDLDWDENALTVFRSVLMKPEHLSRVEEFHASVAARIGSSLAESV